MHLVSFYKSTKHVIHGLTSPNPKFYLFDCFQDAKVYLLYCVLSMGEFIIGKQSPLQVSHYWLNIRPPCHDWVFIKLTKGVLF